MTDANPMKENVEKDVFTCPHCGFKAHYEAVPIISYVKYSNVYNFVPDAYRLVDLFGFYPEDKYVIKRCDACQNLTFFVDGKQAFPAGISIHPNEGLPDFAKLLFAEAMSIVALSPRSSCTLLRSCLEVLVNEKARLSNTKLEGNTLFQKVNELNPPQALLPLIEVVRKVGNEHAHAGETGITKEESYHFACAMAELINVLANNWIAIPKKTKQLLDRINKK